MRTNSDGTETKSSYGSGGDARDYTSMGTWESATDIDYSGESQGVALEIYNDPGCPYDDTVILNAASNTTATKFRTIRALPADEHNGIPGNGAGFSNTSASRIFQCGDNYDLIHHLYCKSVFADGSFPTVDLNDPYAEAWDVIIYDCANSGAGVISGFYSNDNATVFANCLVHNVDGYGFYGIPGAGDTISMYNCVADSCADDGFITAPATGETVIMKNCVALRSTNEDFDINGVGTNTYHYCHSDDATAGSSNNCSSSNGDFSGTEYMPQRGHQTIVPPVMGIFPALNILTKAVMISTLKSVTAFAEATESDLVLMLISPIPT
jgi:hypothetical protein